MKILLIGYGNPGRLDDGLGPALAERFQTLETVGAGDDRARRTRLQNVQDLELQNPPRPSATPPVEGNFQALDLQAEPVFEKFQGLEDVSSAGRMPAVQNEAGGTPAVQNGAGGTPAVRIAGVPPALTIESNYQLNVEDAAQIAEYDVVIFADASTDAEPPFMFTSVEPEEGGLSFSSHSVSAPQLMGMVKELFHAQSQAYMLAIRGYEFNEFGEELSEKAQENLEEAVEFLKEWLLMMPDK